MKTIKKIVFTGGPCSGKTTFMSRAEEIFGERGYRVIVDNESATDLISGGISPATLGMYEFQKYVVSLQLAKEKICSQAAEEIEGDKVLILIDRALLDNESYVGHDAYCEILKDFDINYDEINSRYDMVVHLVTSAKGKEEAYSFSTNASRYETVEQARAMDDTALEAWKNHPNRVIIGNETDFEVKMHKAIQSVFEYLGEESPVEKFKKYLVEFDDDILEKLKGETNYTRVHIIQHYLESTRGIERRIRKRDRNGSTLYYYSEAKVLATNERIKKDRIISEREYFDYIPEIDQKLKPIDKERHSFIFDEHFFKLDVFRFDKSKGLLSLQMPDDGVINLPPYIKVIKEVTDNSDYKNYNLAQTEHY
ncbi:MAG: AAA family ATPase [Erysipelotrichaceae bacterium]|nr:AAA family ATPase [Erysipelotrichaceae bacterium]